MASGFLVSLGLTIAFPDDIPALGSLTGGVVGLAVNLVVFLVVSAVTGQSADERRHIADMFAAAARPVRRPAITAPGIEVAGA